MKTRVLYSNLVFVICMYWASTCCCCCCEGHKITGTLNVEGWSDSRCQTVAVSSCWFSYFNAMRCQQLCSQCQRHARFRGRATGVFCCSHSSQGCSNSCNGYRRMQSRPFYPFLIFLLHCAISELIVEPFSNWPRSPRANSNRFQDLAWLQKDKNKNQTLENENRKMYVHPTETYVVDQDVKK